MRKLVRRYNAERYLFITIISFAFSISGTRFFLDLTGYPQIGGSELHIAHVLWGGLLLFAGGLFPLIFANKRAFDLSALFSGVGVGLFIDEVGKFITSSNDYFFPAAAPIIYAFFLLTLLVFLLVRRSRPQELRPTLYHVIEQFEEILEGDLSRLERDWMLEQIQSALEKEEGSEKDSELASIARDMIAYLKSQEENLVPHQFDFLEKYLAKWLNFEKAVFSRENFYKNLAAAWGLWGVFTLIHPLFALWSAQTRITLSGIWASLLASEKLILTELSASGSFRLIGEAVGGVLLLIAAFLAFRGRKHTAAILSIVSLLLMLLVVNIFIFYYDQFSSLFYVIMQLSLFMITVRYNQRYLQ